MTWRRRVLGGVGVFAVLVLVVPLLWWQFFGPDRFRGLELGVDPSTGAAADFDGVPESLLQFLPGDSVEVESAPEPVIELPPLTMSPSTKVTVLFSVGSNGMSQWDANRLRVGDISDRGSDKLTDTIMLLISDKPTGKAALLSLPRDLWLSHRGHRINETFARRGAQAFVDDVSRVSGLPVHHLVQVNFTAFADLVDALDGVTLRVGSPMADLHSALYVPEAGCWRFDGASALAYARSRQALTTKDGGRTWRYAPGGNDFARIDRQQALLAAAWDQMRGPSLVRRIPDLVRLADGMTIDAGLGLDDVVDLARAFKDVAAGRVEGHTLPTVDRRIGEAQVLAISYSRALPLYARLRSWPPGSTSSASPSPSASPSASPNPSASPSASPSPSASSSSSAAPAPEPAPAAAIPNSGCSRSQAYELPSNPLDYLAAIADRDPVPPYNKTRSRPREDPSPEPSETEPSPSPSEPSESEPESPLRPDPAPSATPEPDPSESEGLCLPTCDDASDEPSPDG